MSKQGKCFQLNLFYNVLIFSLYFLFSTVSSGINAGGIIILEDFVQAKCTTLTPFTKIVISRITGQLF